MIVAFRHQGLAKGTVDAVRDRYHNGQSIDYAAEALEKEKTEGVIISSSHFEDHAAGEDFATAIRQPVRSLKEDGCS
jgi:hypothetical protein